MTDAAGSAHGGLRAAEPADEHTTWHGEPALRVRGGEGLEVVVVPGRGGKLVSLTDPTGREWLVQPVLPLPVPARPGVRFVDQEMCGWDECVPTVDACVVGGAALPGHGEAWTTPWVAHGAGWWGYDGVVLPYRLSRRVEPTGAGLRLSYRAVATGGVALPFQWVAHPQLLAPPGSRVVLPESITHIEGKFGVDGLQPWTETLAGIDHRADGEALKVWVERTSRASWAGLELADGTLLRMSWDVAEIPYLALWIEAAMVSRERVIALEPSTGSREELGESLEENGCAWLHPGAPVTWSLDIEVRPARPAV